MTTSHVFTRGFLPGLVGVLAVSGLCAGTAAAAPVSWTGLGDGVNWSDQNNWSGNALPGPADDVTINVAANPLIVVAGVNPVIQSLNTAETIRFNTGSTFTTTTASSTAPLSIAGGFIAGGTWTFTGAGAFLVIGGAEGRLQNPSISGEVICVDANSRLRVGPTTTFTALRFRSSGQSVAFGPGFVLASQIIADGPSAQGFVETTADGTFTVGPTGSITNAPGLFTSITIGQPYWYSTVNTTVVQGTILNAGSGTLTIDPSVLTVPATGRIQNTGTGTTNIGVRTGPLNWTNSGTLRVTDGVMNALDTFTNAGTIEVAGGRFAFDTAWTNAGTIAVTGSGRLNLSGAFTTASIGTITRGGAGNEGIVAVTGQWNNTGATFNLTAATGSYILDGGTITGGTVTTAGGAAFRFLGGQGILTGVNYVGQVLLDTTNARVQVNAGTTISGIRVSGSQAGASFAPGYVVNIPIVIEGNGNIGTFGIDSAGSGALTLGPTCSITATGSWTGSVTIGPAWWVSTASSVINQGTINIAGANRTVTLGGDQFTNQAGGSITLASGVTLNAEVTGFNTNTWTNAGTISFSGGVVNFNDLWSNTGTFAVTNATCNLDGIFVPASPLSLTRSGSTVNITGRLNNTGATTNLGPATGSWRLNGGTIIGGNLGGTPTERLIVSSTGTFDSVTLTSELLLDENNARPRFVGTTSAPSIRLRGVSAGISFSNGYVISYPIISDSPTNTQHGLDSITSNSTLTVGPGGSFTTAPGSLGSISIGESWWANGVATLVNEGLISSSAVDRVISILPAGSFSNAGTVRGRAGVDINVGGLSGNVSGFDVADAGSSLTLNGNYTLAGTLAVGPGTTATLRGTWGNTGTIAINNGTLELDGTFSLANLGTFTNVGGSVSILGTLNNAAGLTLNAATGSWTLVGGTINGGTINQTQGSRLNFASAISTLNNVQITSELVMSRINGRVRMLGTSRAPTYRLTGQGAGLAFSPGYVMNETIFVEGLGGKGIETLGAGTLTIGPAGRVLVSGGNLSIGAFFESGVREINNQGLIEATNSGSNVFIVSDRLTNYNEATGQLTGGTWRFLASSGIFYGREIRINAATIEYSGINGSIGEISNLAENVGTLIFRDDRDASIQFNPGNPTGLINRGRLVLGAGSRLTLGTSSRPSNFTQDANGTTRFELGGESVNTGYGSLRVFGQASLAGTVEAAYVNNFTRACGQLFQVIDANSRVGQFTSTNVPPLTEESVFLVFYGGADVRMTVSARADFNEDGFLDFFDYSEFVDCFEGNCPPGFDADFNRDGFVDFFDYLDFVFRFEAGCD